jgi:hypothetical protein
MQLANRPADASASRIIGNCVAVPGRLELPTFGPGKRCSVRPDEERSAAETFAHLKRLSHEGRKIANLETHPMIGKAQITLILLALATASTPALARGSHYRHHHHGWHGYGYHGYGYHGSYNYGGPHYSTGDYYNNSRQLDGTR